ncbi:hypothetical protein D8I24_6001 [Cupriavidus necator H850]|nr:hypothetical protein D8I24_6001 [Cupriavidus necator H850]
MCAIVASLCAVDMAACFTVGNHRGDGIILLDSGQSLRKIGKSDGALPSLRQVSAIPPQGTPIHLSARG